MEIKDIFLVEKRPTNLKLKDFTFINLHPDFDRAYFVNKFDDNNFNIAEVVLRGKMVLGLFPKYTYEAGTSIKTLDLLMLKYLENRKSVIDGFLSVKDLITNALNGMTDNEEEIKKLNTLYGTEIPVKLLDIDKISSLLGEGYKALYVRDNKSIIPHGGNTINITLYKEEKISEERVYIFFRLFEIIKKKEKTDEGEYFVFDLPEIAIPTFLLK